MTLNIGRAGLLLFGGFILYIAGVYLGSFFLYFFYVYLLYVLFALLQLVTALLRLREYEEFSTSHPVKGEALDYQFSLANESLLPTPLIRIRFFEVHPGAPPLLPPVERVLKGGGRITLKARISCPFRGVYRVGADRIELGDLLGLLSLRKRLVGRTFYVLPRIFPVADPFFSSRRIALSADILRAGREEDFSLFQGMRPYREPESVRHMDWKRFISTGLPVLKEYGTTSEPGVSIYLDLRSIPQHRGNPYAVEDCVMEVFVSLVRFYLSGGIPVRVRAVGSESFDRRIRSEEDFRTLHNETAAVAFNGSISPAALLSTESPEGMEEERTVLFVTHREDGGILELVERLQHHRHGVAAALITVGMGASVRRGVEQYLKALAEQGCMVKAIARPEEIERQESPHSSYAAADGGRG